MSPLPNTDLTLDQVRQKLAGLHFAKEALTKGEREILYLAEALLRELDRRSAPSAEEWLPKYAAQKT